MEETVNKAAIEEVPPNVMRLIDEFVRRYGIRKASALLDRMELIHTLMAADKQNKYSRCKIYS